MLDEKFNIYHKKKYLKQYKILWNNKKTKQKCLNLFLDIKLFYKLISNDHNWNMALGGGLIMFERNPNKFVPDIPFSLNFLRV